MKRKMQKPRRESQNFLTALLTLALTVLTIAGGVFDIDPTAVSDAVMGGNWATLIIMAPNIVTPILKIKWEAGLWGRLKKSKNFWTQAVSVIVLGLGLFNVLPPQVAAALASVVHMANSALHFNE